MKKEEFLKVNESEWVPESGEPRKRRCCEPLTHFCKKRANHRNTILKDWAERLEPEIEPKVPENYNSPFDKGKCAYCLDKKIGPTGDEFRPSTQRGRQNEVNCLDCCSRCNSSKQDKCGSKLIEWIEEVNPKSRKEIPHKQKAKIINWYQQNEKYLLIPLDAYDRKNGKRYTAMKAELDEKLNKIYKDLS